MSLMEVRRPKGFTATQFIQLLGNLQVRDILVFYIENVLNLMGWNVEG
jgi:hypothetical protein